MNEPIEAGALFAGYGGLDLAVRTLFPNVVTSWVSEIDTAPSQILTQQFPDAENLGDVTTIDWDMIRATRPVKILTGGFPCQDISTAGLRRGLRDGTRSGLWYHMARAIQALRPELVVIENVRGILSAEADGYVEPCPWCMGETGDGEPAMRALGAVLADLASLGYDAAWCGLRAADVGAPHGRYRIFVIAWPQDSDPDWICDENGRGFAGMGRRPTDLNLLRTPTAQLAANGGSQHPAKRRAGGHGPTLADEVEFLLPTPQAMDTAGAMPDRQSVSGYGAALRDIAYLLPTPAVNDMGAGKTVADWDAWTDRMKNAHSNGNGHGRSLDVEARRMPSAVKSFGPYAAAVERWQYILGRRAPHPTEPTGKDGAHRLSPRFVEWMMGLPDGWVTSAPISRAAQLKALGNGVVPQQATAALRHLLGVREIALTMPTDPKGTP